ncbi:shikimate dehydrogenase [Paracoccus sp. J39]|uniref:shikimate dehydrogenase family protein n=1 Tax=Paracoccus sp. J39 TaxID=935848 RepID=UPI001E4DA924|nr:shikimate dehydrogenase [Paracoccus sp. J39]
MPIIGDPIIYARSPVSMTQEFRIRGENRICVPMQVPQDALAAVLDGLSRVPNVDGVLVTMPHKTAGFAHCASVSARSRLLRVVSVMRRDAKGGWHGDIMDGLSFVRAQIDNGARPQGARALLLGAGGAGSAIAIALLDAGVAELIIHDTDADRAAQLVASLTPLGKGRVTTGPADPAGCTMVCNATPLGMSDDDPLPVDPTLLRPEMFVGDVIAGHGETAFLREARAAGCRTANGDQMVDAAVSIMADFIAGKDGTE